MKFNLRKFIPHSPKRLLSTLLLQRHTAVELVVIVLGAIVSIGVVQYIIWQDPAPEFEAPERLLTLRTNTIDTLELWVEERQTAYEEGIKLPIRTLFKIPTGP